MKTTTKPEVLKVSDYALIHHIPTYALNYLACGEDESLAPEVIENIKEWEKDYYLAHIVEGQQVALHSATPAFGSPCPCVKYYVLPHFMGAVLSWINPGCRMTNCYLVSIHALVRVRRGTTPGQMNTIKFQSTHS